MTITIVTTITVDDPPNPRKSFPASRFPAINHQDKFSALLQLGYVTKLEYPEDWAFRVEGGTQKLADQQATVFMANEMLNELLNFK